jgi:hypothetical protein
MRQARYPELADDARPWHDAQRILLSTEPFAFTRRDAQALAQRWRKPVELVDGEWTSWYGPRAIAAARADAPARNARPPRNLTAERKGRPWGGPGNDRKLRYSGTRMPTVTAQ